MIRIMIRIKRLSLLALAVLLLSPISIVNAQTSSTARRRANSLFADLLTPTAGETRYCTNCSATSPCTDGGTGAIAERVGTVWNCSVGGGGAGSGDVAGPASAIDDAIPTFNGTGGKTLQITDVTIIGNNISTPGTISTGVG